MMKLKKIEFNKIYNMNCITGMTLIPDKKIDLIITDPPFAIDFKAKKENYNRTASRVMQVTTKLRLHNIMIFHFSG